MQMSDIFGIIFVLSIVSGITCAGIAYVRGVHPGGWFALGFLLNLPAILFVSIAQPAQYVIEKKGLENGTHKKCDYCAEIVKKEAVKCRYCASDIEGEDIESEELDNVT